MEIPLSWSQLNPFADKKQPPLNEPKKVDDPNKKVDDPNDPNFKDPNKAKEGDDPLLEFESLWQPNKDKDGKVIEDTNTNDSAYLPQIDGKKMGELVSKMNFTNGITAEELAAIKEGGDNGVNAILSIVNKVGRQSFQTAFAAANKVTEQGFANAKTRFSGEIPEHVRNMMTENGMVDTIAITKNPAFEPLVSSVKAQFLKKYPKATPNQIQVALKQYFDYLQKELTGGVKKDEPVDDNTKKLTRGAPDADFAEWLGKDILGTLQPSDTNQT